MNYGITDARRDEYRRTSKDSYAAKVKSLNGDAPKSIHKINVPKLNPEKLMPQLPKNGYRSLSLFSGGGGLDLGFERAGFEHVASYEILEIAGKTLKSNRPDWKVYFGEEGDVRKVDWTKYKGKVDLIHGGPPCQPFSIAGQQKGANDPRDMWPEFVRAVNEIKPKCFVAENVPGLLNKCFEKYVQTVIIDSLKDYSLFKFILNSKDFGVPQSRSRVIFVGFRNKTSAKAFVPTQPTHYTDSEGQLLLTQNDLQKCLGAREALGLSNVGFDDLAPTIRSAFTGKRNTTSVLNSKAAEKIWNKLQLWPNGIQIDRESANAYVAKFNHFRLSVQDIGLLQGFPESWKFEGAVYQILGQIGNSVAPPVAYNIAVSVLKALKKD